VGYLDINWRIILKRIKETSVVSACAGIDWLETDQVAGSGRPSSDPWGFIRKVESLAQPSDCQFLKKGLCSMDVIYYLCYVFSLLFLV
jgi:hypothetical protein